METIRCPLDCVKASRVESMVARSAGLLGCGNRSTDLNITETLFFSLSRLKLLPREIRLMGCGGLVGRQRLSYSLVTVSTTWYAVIRHTYQKQYGQLKRQYESLTLGKYLNDLPSLIKMVEEATDIVVCTPLYLDGLPSQVIRFMEAMRREYPGDSKRIYVLANMGLYESRQLVNLFDEVRQWCGVMGFHYCGGLGVSAGELIGVLMQHLPFSIGFTRNVARGMKKLAEALEACQPTEDTFAEPFCFPRWLYIRVANSGWKKMAKANGLKPEELFREV